MFSYGSQMKLSDDVSFFKCNNEQTLKEFVFIFLAICTLFGCYKLVMLHYFVFEFSFLILLELL